MKVVVSHEPPVMTPPLQVQVVLTMSIVEARHLRRVLFSNQTSEHMFAQTINVKDDLWSQLGDVAIEMVPRNV